MLVATSASSRGFTAEARWSAHGVRLAWGWSVTVRLGGVAVVCALVLCSGPVCAQTDGTFALGASVSGTAGIADGTDGHLNPSLLWRFGHGRDGWGWEYGFSWYSADLQEHVGPRESEFGELHVRPFLGGYGYSRRIGRTAVTGRVLAGYAFTSFELHPAFDDAYRNTLGAQTVTTDTSNTFVVKPEVSAWVDVSRKIGLNVSLGYLVARPEVTVSSSLGRDTRDVRADMVMFRVGAVYSLF
jgi:hypothetical protein